MLRRPTTAARKKPLSPLGTYRFLFAAIAAEVVATTALGRSDSFSRPSPGIVAVLGYDAAFWFLSLPLRVLPTGIVYAIWSGRRDVNLRSILLQQNDLS